MLKIPFFFLQRVFPSLLNLDEKNSLKLELWLGMYELWQILPDPESCLVYWTLHDLNPVYVTPPHSGSPSLLLHLRDYCLPRKKGLPPPCRVWGTSIDLWMTLVNLKSKNWCFYDPVPRIYGLLCSWKDWRRADISLQGQLSKLATVIPPVNSVLLNQMSYTEGHPGHFSIFAIPSQPSRVPRMESCQSYDSHVWLDFLLFSLYVNLFYWSWLTRGPSFLHSLPWMGRRGGRGHHFI